MDEILELQQEHEKMIDAQNALIVLAETKDANGKERGFLNDEEKQFDTLTEQRKAIVKKIEQKQRFEAVKSEKILSESRKIGAPAIGKPEQEYSLERAFQAAATGNWDNAGKEKEVQQDLARGNQKGYAENRLFIDPNMMIRANTVGNAGAGAELVGTTLQPQKFIDVLWNESILGKLPVVNNTGLAGNYSVNTQTTKPTATMVGEVAAAPAAQDLGTGLKIATPKEMMTKAQFSRMLAIQSTPNIMSLLKKNVINPIAEKLDEMFIGGTGVAPILQGITQGVSGAVPAVIAGAYSAPMATNGVAINYAAIVDLWKGLAAQNVGGDLQFITNSQVVAKLMGTLKDSANTNSGYILSEVTQSLLGSPIVRSQSVPGVYTRGTGTNLSPLILGNFRETEVYQWDKIAIEFDYISQADNSQIVCRSYSFWDFLHLRPQNYAVLGGIITT